jgi:hypothetical protein
MKNSTPREAWRMGSLAKFDRILQNVPGDQVPGFPGVKRDLH